MKKPNKIIVCLSQSEDERLLMISRLMVSFGFARTNGDAKKIIALNKETKKRSLDILALIGFKTKAERDSMTNDDWNKFNAEYKKKYGSSFQEDLDKPDEVTPPAETYVFQ